MKKNSSDLASIPLFQDNKVFYFLFLSWEHRGQYLRFTDEERQNMVKRTKYVSLLSCWKQAASSVSVFRFPTISLLVWLSGPRMQNGTIQWSTEETKEDNVL